MPAPINDKVMRGINVPSGQLLQADLVTWEATYANGVTLREREGARYAGIDRSQLVRFALVLPGEVLFETWPPASDSGGTLVYRRRTEIAPGVLRHVGFLLGWVPGVLFWIDPGAAKYRVANNGWILGDPNFHPILPRPQEGETWSLSDELRVAVGR
jgi:hypothetical protein